MRSQSKKQLVTSLPIIPVTQKAMRISSKGTIQSRRVRTREEHRVKDSERNPTPPQPEDIKFPVELTNK